MYYEVAKEEEYALGTKTRGTQKQLPNACQGNRAIIVVNFDPINLFFCR